jgi:acetyl-CoA acyltransferase
MLRPIAVLDSEVNTFGRHVGHSAVACAAEVAATLLDRNPAVARRVGLISVGAARMAQAEGLGNGLPQAIGQLIGLSKVAGLEAHAFCASANLAIHQAALALETGQADVALVVGLEHVLEAQPTGPLQPEAGGPASQRGFTPPVFYAMCASRYLHETGATVADIAQVSVNNRRFGVGNEHARLRAAVTLQDVLHSRPIAAPLTLLQCCSQADGAGALLLVATDVVAVDDSTSAVDLLGLGSGSGDADSALLTTFPEDVRAARQAYEVSGVSPEDIDVAEVHDAFSISQVIHLEDIGLAPRGEGWRHAVQSEPRHVINPSGGLLSRGHPLGATGIAQFDSVRRYLNDRRIDPRLRRFGLIQEAGGLRPLGQVLSECAVLGRNGS